MPEVKDREETEDTPYWEWDYDHSDLLDKLESYIDDAYHQDIPRQGPTNYRDPELVQRCQDYAIDHKLLSVTYDGGGHIGDVVFRHAETLKHDQLAELVTEITGITYEWNDDDQCFYEVP
jgi:hypothetical protein